MGFRVEHLADKTDKEEDAMPTLITEKRLYETPDGELVEEVEVSGSLFCCVGAELTGEDAERYVAYCGAEPAAAEETGEDAGTGDAGSESDPATDETGDAEKAVEKSKNKAAPKSKNKGA